MITTDNRNTWAGLVPARFCFHRQLLLVVILMFMAITSCTREDYETGEGNYSYYSAEMTLISLQDSLVNKAELDDGRFLNLNTPLKSAVLRKNFSQSLMGDSCRLMLHFNKGDETSTTVEATKLHGADAVMMPNVALADTLKKEVKTDPLNIISSWKSKNGKFYNYNLSVKTGTKSEDSQPQTLGIVCDSVSVAYETIYLRLVHDQKDVPEFYSIDAFLSISREQIDDIFSHYGIQYISNPKVKLCVNTYQGKKQIEL